MQQGGTEDFLSILESVVADAIAVARTHHRNNIDLQRSTQDPEILPLFSVSPCLPVSQTISAVQFSRAWGLRPDPRT